MTTRTPLVYSLGPLLFSLPVLALVSGCSADPDPGAGASGGKPSVGGVSSVGGGGASTATGGSTGATGGTGASAGGTTATAGGSTGGTSATAGGTSATAGGTSATTGGAAGFAGSGTGGGSTDPGGKYNPDFEEFSGDDCQVGTPTEAANTKLPDLFKKLDGTRITKKSDWKCRRAELKKIVETFIHGPKPGAPEKVTGTVTATKITVHVEHMGKSTDFEVSVSIPSGAAQPAAAIIGLGGGSLDRSVVSGEGVASINYNNGAISSETSRTGKFSEIYGTSTGASAQVGWAWGVSRIIDVLVSEKAAGRNNIIDPTAIGVTGCSRLGKGAFTIGAFDERIALGIPHESGTGGVSAFRIVNTNPMGPNGKGAQSLSSAWTEAQGWFGTVFQQYTSGSKVDSIPGDTHSLVAMYAPRGLLVLDNSRIGELCASCQHAASAAGALVYKALGVEGNIAYHGGNPSDPHDHCMFYESQKAPLQNAIRAFLTRKGQPMGRIEPQPAGTADLTKWIDWDAPALQ